MSEIIHIGIIDDMPVGEFDLPKSATLCGISHELKPTKLFATGDWDKSGKRGLRIDLRTNFETAIAELNAFQGLGVFFFDYHLGSASVKMEDFSNCLPQASTVSKKSDPADILNYFNDGRQGLLLAIILATNPNADVDIWLGSGQTGGIVDNVGKLQYIKQSRVNVDDFAYSLGRQSSDSKAVRTEKIDTALTKFLERRELKDPGFWTANIRSQWFECPEVPHHKPNTPPESLIIYLGSLGLDRSIAHRWLMNNSCYEALKHFVGSCARADFGDQNGALEGKPPILGCLVLILLQSVGPGEWADAISWNPGGSPLDWDNVYDGDRLYTRRFILLLYHMFHAVKGSSDQNSGMSVRANFERKSDGIHFLVDFGPAFDCSIGKDSSHASLLARVSQFCYGLPGDGETTKAIFDWMANSRSPRKGQLIFASIYPYYETGSIWTRFDFKAKA